VFASCCQVWAHRECAAGREGFGSGDGGLSQGDGLGRTLGRLTWLCLISIGHRGAALCLRLVWRVRVSFVLVRAVAC
jgi:hypothetical protein